MSIDQENKVDILASSPNLKSVNLIITDHLSWDEDVNEHLYKLQEKINRYLAFVEGGEMVDKYPEQKEKKIIIQVIGKYSLNDLAKEFYERAGKIVRDAGFDLEFKLAESKEE